MNNVTPSCSHDANCECALKPFEVPSDQDCQKKKATKNRKKVSTKTATKPVEEMSPPDLQSCNHLEINALYPCPILRDIDADTKEFASLQFHVHLEEPAKVEKLQKRKKYACAQRKGKGGQRNAKKGRKSLEAKNEVASSGSEEMIQNRKNNDDSFNDVLNDSRRLVVDLDLSPCAAQEEVVTLALPSRNNSSSSLHLSASEERHLQAIGGMRMRLA
jgi:hypothetical protein